MDNNENLGSVTIAGLAAFDTISDAQFVTLPRASRAYLRMSAEWEHRPHGACWVRLVALQGEVAGPSPAAGAEPGQFQWGCGLAWVCMVDNPGLRIDKVLEPGWEHYRVGVTDTVWGDAIKRATGLMQHLGGPSLVVRDELTVSTHANRGYDVSVAFSRPMPTATP